MTKKQKFEDRAMDMDLDKYLAMMTDRQDAETAAIISMAVMYVNLIQAADRLECQLVKATCPERWREELMPVIDVDGAENALKFASTIIRSHLRDYDEQCALLAADMIVKEDGA